jgi:hypothetical protein
VNKGGEMLKDVYRDLRDRRLLPVVIALAVAIVAVPFLLGGGSEPVPPTAPAATSGVAGDGGDELAPVVLADVPGLRDYKQRLSRFNSRDPFKQQMTGKDTAQGGAGNLEQTGDSSSATTDTSVSSSTATDTSSSTSTDTSSSSSTTGGTAPSSPGNSGGKHGGKGEDRIVETTIDVRVGRAGKTKVLRDVEALQFLPGDKRPVVQFVQGDSDGTHAAFVVSADVTETSGDGKCDPGRNDCQFLLMEKGDLQTFVYGDKQETYRLQLLAIHRTTVPVPSSGH